MRTIGEITFGSALQGDDFVGEVSRLVVDPVGRVLTHVVVAPRHESGERRLVPAQLIDCSSDGLRLRCTKQEYEALIRTAGAQIIIDASGGAFPTPSQTLRRSTRAYAVDGGFGRVRGLSVADDGITHYLIRSGVIGRRRIAAVPIGMVRDVVGGVHISMTKRQVLALPAHASDVRVSGNAPSPGSPSSSTG